METYLTTPGTLGLWGFAKRDLSLITARGCPYHCTFCYRPPGEVVRQRSVGNVVLELEQLIGRYGLDGVIFNDELTIVGKERAYEFCDGIEKLGIRWGCVGRVNTVDRELLRRMYSVGCRWITYGIESGSQVILDEMRKDVKVARALDVVRWTQNAGIVTNPTFMVGYPSETRATAMETVRFMKQARLNPDSLFFATPYPGTPLFEQGVSMGRISANVEDYLMRIDSQDAKSLLVNLTRMSDCELVAVRDEILRRVAPPRGPARWFRRVAEVLRQKGPRALFSRTTGKLTRSLRNSD